MGEQTKMTASRNTLSDDAPRRTVAAVAGATHRRAGAPSACYQIVERQTYKHVT